jgi:hypothetical protein
VSGVTYLPLGQLTGAIERILRDLDEPTSVYALSDLEELLVDHAHSILSHLQMAQRLQRENKLLYAEMARLPNRQAAEAFGRVREGQV